MVVGWVGGWVSNSPSPMGVGRLWVCGFAKIWVGGSLKSSLPTPVFTKNPVPNRSKVPGKKVLGLGPPPHYNPWNG